MYKDIISYALADGVTKEHLLKVAEEVVNGWMKKQSGFIKWEINSDKEGAFVDLVFWESKEAAKLAEKEMVNIPNASEWFGCYKQGSISSRNIDLIASF